MSDDARKIKKACEDIVTNISRNICNNRVNLDNLDLVAVLGLAKFAVADDEAINCVLAEKTDAGMSFENAIAVADGLGWPLDKLACRGEYEAG